jgi:protein-S-isoprenylcysteine O-methyltransferase Ste14
VGAQSGVAPIYALIAQPDFTAPGINLRAGHAFSSAWCAFLCETHDMNRDAKFFIIAPVIVVAFVLFKATGQPWSALRVLGLILTLGGAIALIVARLQLGNSFSLLPKARELVTRGIYSRIRNPVYVFSAILIAGLFLYVNRPQFFWIFLILIPIQMMRARAEGKVLEERFGEAYRQYKARTWF